MVQSDHVTVSCHVTHLYINVLVQIVLKMGTKNKDSFSATTVAIKTLTKEARIYSRTDIFLDCSLHKSLCGNNNARETRPAGAGIVFDTRNYCNTRG